MKKVESLIKLKFITPAFIGSVDPHGPSEFSEKALKGALRFWWRAFCAEPGRNNVELLNNESLIFGGQSSRSKFSLTLVQSPLNQKTPNDIGSMPNGVKYLLFSTIPRGRSNPGKAEYINPGSEYSIRIIADTSETMQEVLKSLWLLENFGGLGARSRRGAGSFMVTNLDLTIFNDVPAFLFNSGIHDVNKIEEFLNQGIKKISPKTTDLPKYTAYSTTDKYSYFKVRKVNVAGWESAMNELGQIYSESRSFRKDSYNTQASSLHTFAVSGNTSDVERHPPTKTSFGLPIIYNFKDELAKQNRDDRFSIEAKPSNDFTRRASPLFFKIGEVNNNFYIVALVMWSEFLPVSTKIDLIRKMGKNPINSFQVEQPSKKDIDNFMNTF